MILPSTSGLIKDLSLATTGSKKPLYRARASILPMIPCKVLTPSSPPIPRWSISCSLWSILRVAPLIPSLTIGTVNPLAISRTVVSLPVGKAFAKPPPNVGLILSKSSVGRADRVLFATFKDAKKAGGNTAVATPPSIPTFILLSILAKALSCPSFPTASIVLVGPASKKSPIVCVSSVETTASAKPAALANTAYLPTFCDLVSISLALFVGNVESSRASVSPTFLVPIFTSPSLILLLRSMFVRAFLVSGANLFKSALVTLVPGPVINRSGLSKLPALPVPVANLPTLEIADAA